MLRIGPLPTHEAWNGRCEDLRAMMATIPPRREESKSCEPKRGPADLDT
jgi:hypothetical protein